MPRFPLLLSAATAILLASPAFAQQPGGGAAPPPPAVTVATVKAENVPVTFEYPARVSSSRDVEVRAQVGGILLRRTFNEGSRVKEGDLLFEIDRRPSRRRWRSPRPSCSRRRRPRPTRSGPGAHAGARALGRDLHRHARRRDLAAPLGRRGRRGRRGAAPDRDALARLRLGRGARERHHQPGAGARGLASQHRRPSHQDHPARPGYVNFSAADSEAFSIRNMIESGRAEGSLDTLKVTVRFGNGTNYDKQGKIDFTSTNIDQSTGTILSRASCPIRQPAPARAVRARRDRGHRGARRGHHSDGSPDAGPSGHLRLHAGRQERRGRASRHGRPRAGRPASHLRRIEGRRPRRHRRRHQGASRLARHADRRTDGARRPAEDDAPGAAAQPAAAANAAGGTAQAGGTQ